MEKKPIFNREEIEAIFKSSYNQNYKNLKRSLAGIVFRYLLAEPEAKKENEEVYKKCLSILEKNLLCDPLKMDETEREELVEMSFRSEIELSKKDYDIGSTMGMIMKLILELE